MDSSAGNSVSERIQGQLLRVSARREVAIYLRDGSLWIADFIDGHGELVEPLAWFRFNCGTPSARHARRRMLLESGMPLTTQIVARIARLHRLAGTTDDAAHHQKERQS